MDSLLIRANISPTIGTGHVMRCLALAEVCMKEGIAVHVLLTEESGLDQRLRDAGCTVDHLQSDDLTETIAKAKEISAEWVVVDGYTFDSSYQQALKDAGLRILFIDDYGQCDTYVSDLVLNQNIYASTDFYPQIDANTTLLLGTQYTLLRQEFASTVSEREVPDTARNILVTLGGADPDNCTQDVLLAITAIENITVKVVVGGANPNRDELQQLCTSELIEMIVNTSDMKALMEWADIAIAGGGSTCYEFAYMGLPALTMVLAENQKPVAKGLEDAGATINLGWHEACSKESITAMLTDLLGDRAKREAMSTAGKKLIDGKGAQRVLEAMHNTLSLRSALQQDAKLLFAWANDPIVRASAFSQDPIEWEQHESWFDKKLSDDKCLIWIAEVDSMPVGQIRFDCEGDSAEVDLHLAPQQRGKGYGTQLIVSGTQKIFAETPIQSIEASVKKDNAASAKAFEKAGFVQTKSDDDVLTFTLQKNG